MYGKFGSLFSGSTFYLPDVMPSVCLAAQNTAGTEAVDLTAKMENILSRWISREEAEKQA